MRYPTLLRSVLGSVPGRVNIDGPGRTAILAALDPLFYPSVRGRLVTCARGGHTLRLDGDHANERLLYYAFDNVRRTYAQSDLGILLRQLIRQPTDLFLDVGANLGIYSLLAVDAGGGAVLFEPEPRHLAFLQRNETVFGRTFGCALSNFSGAAHFHVGRDSKAGVSSLVSFAGGSHIYSGVVQVPVRTLDDIVPREGIDPAHIRLIKVDVEGSEAAAVAGMTRLLASARPTLWCEVRGPRSDRARNSYRDVIEQLTPLAYVPSRVVRGREQPFAVSDDLPQVFDMLFRPAEQRE